MGPPVKPEGERFSGRPQHVFPGPRKSRDNGPMTSRHTGSRADRTWVGGRMPGRPGERRPLGNVGCARRAAMRK
jgi:hypothetical protein